MKVSEAVQNIVYRDRSVYNLLKRDIVNVSALALEIKPLVDEATKDDVNVSTITMAIKRLMKAESEKNIEQLILSKMKNISYEVVMTSDICSLNVKASHSSEEKLTRFAKIVKSTDAFLNYTIGGNEISVITSAKNKTLLEEMFSGEAVLSKISGLSCLVITFQKGFLETEGVIYKVFKCLYDENINVFEVYSTHNKLTLVVKEIDESRAYGVLKNFL